MIGNGDVDGLVEAAFAGIGSGEADLLFRERPVIHERTRPMFIAMNRFRVKRGAEEDFETVWRTRERYLDEVPGFVEFHLLRGPEREDHTLYASHTVWADKEAFEGWTRSEAFRKAHRTAGGNGALYLGHPEFEGFESVDEMRARPRQPDLV